MTEEKDNQIELIEVPTQYGLAFKDSESEKAYTTEELLVKIANDIREIRKSTVGK